MEHITELIRELRIEIENYNDKLVRLRDGMLELSELLKVEIEKEQTRVKK